MDLFYILVNLKGLILNAVFAGLISEMTLGIPQ